MSESRQRFEGKVSIVTGAGGGIGEGYAKALAAEGAAVVVADINLEGAERVVAEIAASGGRALAVKVDVSDPASCDAMAAATMAEFGRIDHLVNNAAIFGGMEIDLLLTVDWDYYRRFMSVNMDGALLCIRSVWQHMAAGGGPEPGVPARHRRDVGPSRRHRVGARRRRCAGALLAERGDAAGAPGGNGRVHADRRHRCRRCAGVLRRWGSGDARSACRSGCVGGCARRRSVRPRSAGTACGSSKGPSPRPGGESLAGHLRGDDRTARALNSRQHATGAVSQPDSRRGRFR